VDIGTIGYSFAALLFFLLSVLLFTSWRGKLEGAFLLSAVFITALWHVSAVIWLQLGGVWSSSAYVFLENARNIAWFIFLFRLLVPFKMQAGRDARLFTFLPGLVLIGASLMLLLETINVLLIAAQQGPLIADLELPNHLGLAIIGLILIEQLFRNTRLEQRWKLKYLYFGIGSIFAYDFLLYADAFLFTHVDQDLWNARGYVNALVVPMLAVAAARNPGWSVKVFVSRKVVFHTTALVGAGIYLLFMSAIGYYIRYYGGTWGKAAQMVFFFLALATLVALLFSSHLRSRTKVFLNKHFFRYKYDYREEWLRIIHTLSDGEPGTQIRERVIKALADLVDSGGGLLWMRDESGSFQSVSHWQAAECHATLSADSSLANFFKDRDWIVDLDEYAGYPDLYENLQLPGWLEEIQYAWLLLPIRHHSELIGFMVLIRPRAPRQINWEDRDLLKTASQQAASYLALLKASEDLARANQFEAFNRLSAFVVHDLKNLVAQLDLVVTNAARHKNNPAFMEDAINTVDHAATKMKRLLAQLRQGRFSKSSSRVFPLAEALQEAVRGHSGFLPVPELQVSGEAGLVVADKDRLSAVIGHLIKNAQEATADDGFVRLEMDEKGGELWVTISDNGSGMEAGFIRDRLFQPFETTKGNAGMGIGVYESREFIRSLGGVITVESEVGRGTVFTLRLPVHNVQPSPDGMRSGAVAEV
jgi:putative PEP-CTERM system histidine kinase